MQPKYRFLFAGTVGQKGARHDRGCAAAGTVSWGMEINMQKRSLKKIFIAVMLFVAILIVCALGWYLRPIPKNVTVTLCSLEGECVEAVFDVTWQRHLLAPTELKGTIELDGMFYRSVNIDSNRTFMENLEMKLRLNGVSSPLIFQVWPTNKLLTDSDRIDFPFTEIDSEIRDFELIAICVTRDGSPTFYYGPAGTAEEAQAVFTKLYYDE